MKKLSSLKERFDEKFRPVYKKSFTQNDTMEIPGDCLDWISALDDIQDFIEQELKKEREENLEIIERYLGLARYGNLEEVDTCYERAFEDIINTIKNKV